MKKFFKILSICMTIIFSFLFAAGSYASYSLPDNFKVTQNCSTDIKTYVPVKIKTQQTNECLTLFNHKHFAKKQYNTNLLLMDLIPIKTVNVEIVEEKKIIPAGIPFGVKIFTQGVLIVGISDIETENGLENPAKLTGLKKGDVILTVNENEIKSNEELIKIVENCGGESLKIEVMRNNMRFDLQIQPVKCCIDNAYRIGIWVRDSSAGIGTLTFLDPESHVFGGLGHGICDIDTGELLPLSHGDIVKASINGIVKGTKGIPGELKGYFLDSEPIGELSQNTNLGVYGTLTNTQNSNEPIVLAMKQQVQKGKAQMVTTIDGMSPQHYDIDIQSINYNEALQTKNMIIKITDENLLSQTGGIIQGMSGSPIIQNGMLVGAVTHVFINDPQKGYAIFAENMLPYLTSSAYTEHKKAS
ncbi:MAG: SpoIVB peptidase [Eubacteriales bacterium SKADARSKE-1]|nr:SpoIVB peptidase [Eubacteriales bacterium SKADARSKE-1]